MAFFGGAGSLKEVRGIIPLFKATEFMAGEKIINKNSWDRSLLVLAEGEIIKFDDQDDNQLYTEGSILGAEQFLFNK